MSKPLHRPDWSDPTIPCAMCAECREPWPCDAWVLAQPPPPPHPDTVRLAEARVLLRRWLDDTEEDRPDDYLLVVRTNEHLARSSVSEEDLVANITEHLEGGNDGE